MTRKERREKAEAMRDEARKWERCAGRAKTDKWRRMCQCRASDLRNDAYYLEHGRG